MTTVKFAYLRDPKNQDRVITIARTVEDNIIYFAVATNRCSGVDSSGNFFPFLVDKFNKNMAKKISTGRLYKKPNAISRVEGEAPHITILRYLAENGNKYQQRACVGYLSKPDPRVHGAVLGTAHAV